MEAPHYVAGAFFTKNGDKPWRCVRAAPIIRWMLDKDATFIHNYLKRKNYVYEWLD